MNPLPPPSLELGLSDKQFRYISRVSEIDRDSFLSSNRYEIVRTDASEDWFALSFPPNSHYETKGSRR
jgi:hypothetical protein